MKAFLIIFTLIAATVLSGCKEEPSCYDPEMEKANAGILCTADCPGVCGCDGQFYCNACVAAAKGIRVVKDGPCN